ncbi:MAG: hypothetical protein WA628_25015 [Terriglobales bacterium]
MQRCIVVAGALELIEDFLKARVFMLCSVFAALGFHVHTQIVQLPGAWMIRTKQLSLAFALAEATVRKYLERKPAN